MTSLEVDNSTEGITRLFSITIEDKEVCGRLYGQDGLLGWQCLWPEQLDR